MPKNKQEKTKPLAKTDGIEERFAINPLGYAARHKGRLGTMLALLVVIIGYFSTASEDSNLPPECRHLELVDGKVNNDTQFFLLGEVHLSKSQKEIRGCAEALARQYFPEKPHRFAFENVEQGKEVSCQKMGVSNQTGRTCVGWDNLAVALEARIFSGNLNTLNMILERYPDLTKVKIENLQEDLTFLLDKYREIKNLEKDKAYKQWHTAICQFIANIKTTLKEKAPTDTIEDVFNSISVNLIGSATKPGMLPDGSNPIDRRNDGIRSLIKQTKEEGIKTLVIAGKGHLEKSSPEEKPIMLVEAANALMAWMKKRNVPSATLVEPKDSKHLEAKKQETEREVNEIIHSLGY